MSRPPARKPMDPEDARRALAAWGALYRRELSQPVVARTDRRPVDQLTNEELFAIPSANVSETLKEMVAEAELLGRQSITRERE